MAVSLSRMRTPKAFVSLATAQKLWLSRYGKLTSVRIGRPPGKDGLMLEQLGREELLQRLPLERMGMTRSPGPHAQGIGVYTSRWPRSAQPQP